MLQPIKKLLINGTIIALFAITPYLFSPDIGMGWRIFSIPPFVSSFIGNLILCLIFYLNLYWLYPAYYYRQHFLKFSLINIGLLFISFIFLILITSVAKHPPNHGEAIHHGQQPFIDFGYFIKYALVLAVVVLYKNSLLINEIKLEKSKAELTFLKAQINPHFLFNTLNAIYALTLKKTDTAPLAVQKLSGIMRYLFAEGNQDFVPLTEEINYLKDYVALQELRINPEITTVFFEEKIAITDFIIAPMLLSPFVENAFKYGVNPAEQSHISIIANVSENGLLQFTVSNTIVAVNNVPKNEVGIINTKKRLELLYPQKHKLAITENNNCYIVVLEIVLI